VGGLDLVMIGADDPEAMLRHTQECRERGIPFAADPSQQLARMNGDDIKRLVDGAQYLFTNQYEAALIEQKSGWDADEILRRVGARVVTLGANGVRISRRTEDGDVHVLEVATPKEETKADPTGVGDAFRAGFIAGLSWNAGEERAAQVGCMLATLVIETIGTQEYDLRRGHFLERLAIAYGDEAAAEVATHLRG
jgi:adenosine kinase